MQSGDRVSEEAKPSSPSSRPGRCDNIWSMSLQYGPFSGYHEKAALNIGVPAKKGQ